MAEPAKAPEEYIRQLQTKIRHLENDLKVTRQENAESSKKYFDLYAQLEQKVRQRTAELETAREKLKAQNSELENLLHKAEEANIAKSEFLANVSHELRTPLNSIMGFCDLLKTSAKDEKETGYLESISSSGRSLLQLINDIIELSRIEAGSVKTEMAPVDIRAVLIEAFGIYQTKAEQKGLSFHFSAAKNFPRTVIFDATRLRQIVTNLLGNAVKFTSTGSVNLKLEYQANGNDNADLRIIVEDSGIGIEPDKLEIIFSAFQQQSSASNRTYDGIGLGLTICRKLTHALDGRISVKSEVGEGSTFIVEFDGVEVCTETEDPASAEKPDERLYGNLKNKRILIADDNQENRNLLQTFLSLVDCSVIHAADGTDAVKLAGQEKPDAILMDLQMPVMNGLDATRMLKNKDDLKYIPVIALTASDEKETRLKTEKAGCDAFLSKPFDKEDLFGLLEDVFKTNHPEEEVLLDLLNSEDQRSEVSAFIFKLENEYKEHLTELGETMLINDLLELVSGMKTEAEKFPLEMLHSWINTTRKQCKSYNVEGLEQSVNAYPELISRIKKRMNL